MHECDRQTDRRTDYARYSPTATRRAAYVAANTLRPETNCSRVTRYCLSLSNSRNKSTGRMFLSVRNWISNLSGSQRSTTVAKRHNDNDNVRQWRLTAQLTSPNYMAYFFQNNPMIDQSPVSIRPTQRNRRSARNASNAFTLLRFYTALHCFYPCVLAAASFVAYFFSVASVSYIKKYATFLR